MYDTLITSIIVEVIRKVYMSQRKIAFSSYAMVHIGTTNTIKSRCGPEIVLKSSNDSGGYCFMNILTRERMYSYNWKLFQITDEVTEQVEHLSGDEVLESVSMEAKI